jgi:hypothetical protein
MKLKKSQLTKSLNSYLISKPKCDRDDEIYSQMDLRADIVICDLLWVKISSGLIEPLCSQITSEISS